MAIARTKPSWDQPTFGGPGSDRLDVLPGQFFVRVHPGAIRPHVPTRTRAAFGTSRMAFTTATADAVPEAVAEPLEYLRKNTGLRTCASCSRTLGAAAVAARSTTLSARASRWQRPW